MSAPTRDQFMTVANEIKTTVDRVASILTEPWTGNESPHAAADFSVGDVYHMGYRDGRRAAQHQAAFPPPPPCPSWCDGQHGLEPGDWESEDKAGVEVVRCHGHTVGDVAGKAGVDIVAVTTAQRGTEPFTSAPVLSVWTGLSGAELNGSEVRDLARLMVFAADDLEYRVLGGEQ